MGYRYYETFGVAPAYEFGYGFPTLHLNSVTWSLAKKFSGKITATVNVKNTGKLQARKSCSLPERSGGKAIQAGPGAKGICKTRLLQPGESQTIWFEINPRNLASFDPASSSWVAGAGKYTVKVGASSRDIRHIRFVRPGQELE